LVFASAMYALRWLLFSTVSVPAVLVGLQGLQSLTMAIFMPTAVVMIGQMLPAELRTTGQSLLGLVNGGLATLVGTLAAGRIVDLAGTSGLYRAMSGMALVGAVGCTILLLANRAATSAEKRESALEG
ncbi:MAG TPA: MFS transporter, partial [Symbiobacteriaceae bacterium]|nr:MFS transporter [Symbiobacteriaceae bacterium]